MRVKFIQNTISILRGKKKATDLHHKNQENFPIILSENECSFFTEHVKNAKMYLEFGSGGSTILTLMNTTIPHVTSVESDPNWIKHLKNWEVINDNIKNGRLEFIHVNIGKTGEWGMPVETDKQELFPNYSASVFLNNNDYDGFLLTEDFGLPAPCKPY